MNAKNLQSKWLPVALRQLVPNLGSILIMAAMLFAYDVRASNLNVSATPSTISYQGMLSTAGGTPVNANVELTFRLYNVLSGGTALWTKAYSSVPVNNGLFHVQLNDFPAGIWDNPTLYLGVQVTGDSAELSPREVVSAVPYAMNSSGTLEIPDGSITNAKLNLQGNLDLGSAPASGASLTANYSTLYTNNTGGALRYQSANNIYMMLDQDNNQTDSSFRIYSDTSGATTSDRILLLDEVGNMYLYQSGNLTIAGSLTSNAYIEGNLQTPAERESEKIDRFSQGDVLCWNLENQFLEICKTATSPLVVAVANANGKPIILGAEPIKVLGPVNTGDLLVSSDIPGYAVAWSQVGQGNPPEDIVIAKALGATDAQQGLIQALIK